MPHRNLAGQRRTARGWRRRAMLLCIALLALSLVAGYLLTRPERLARLTAAALQRLTGAQVHIDAAHLSFDGELLLEQVHFRVPELDGELARLGHIEMVHLRPDLAALWRGQLRLRSITLLHPTLHLTRDAEDDRFNYEHLLRPTEQPGQRWLIDALPEVFIRHATLQFADYDGGVLTPLEPMRVQGRLTRDVDRPTVYRFNLRQEGEALLPGVVFHGSLDLADQRVSTELHGFQFTENQRHLLPAELRELWDQLDPVGEMPNLTLSYDQAPDGGLNAELTVQGVALNVPLDGVDSRMQDVAGQFRLRGGKLHVEVTGEIEGIRYRLDGMTDGFDHEAPMAIRVVTDAFDLAEAPAYLAGLPDNVLKHYRRFEPSGRFKIDIALERTQRGGPLEYDGVIDLLGANGRYHKFPYPLQDVFGRIHLTHEQVRIEDVRGRGPTGVEIRLNGTVTPPGRDAAVQLDIEARHGPVDEHLVAALEPDERRALAMFFDEASHRRLVEAGLIRESLFPSRRSRLLAMVNVDAPEPAPVFTLGGRVSANVRVRRPPGPDIKPHVTTRVRPEGPVGLLFEHWPYPLQAVAGEVVIDNADGPARVRIDNVDLRGLSGATGMIAGEVRPRGGGRGVEPDLRISEARMPIDELLMTTVPAVQANMLRRFGLRGEVVGDGIIFAEAQTGEPDYRIAFELTDGRAQPPGTDLAMHDIDARLVLRRKAAELTHLRARRGDATLGGEGRLRWDDGQPSIDVRLDAADVAIEPGLVDLLPAEHEGRARLASWFDQLRPAGTFDAELILGDPSPASADARADVPEDAREDARGDESPSSYRLTLRPNTLSVDWNGQRVDFGRMTGSVVVQDDEAKLDALAAEFADGALSATGTASLAAGGGASLALSGRFEAIQGPWRALLPKRLQTMIDDQQIQAAGSLSDGRLLLRPGATDGPRMEVAGELALERSQAELGVAIRELSGRLDFDVQQHGDEAWPRIALRLDADRLTAADRVVEDLAVRVATAEPGHVLQIDQLDGRLYGGVLVGTGAIDLRPGGHYQTELTLQDVHVNPFLAAAVDNAEPNPESTATQAPADEPADAPPTADEPAGPVDTGPGRLHASVTLSGEADVATRSGRGDIIVRDARFYERPLTLALLQAVNFSLPLAGSFDRGEVNFLIEGERVYFDRLLLEAPSVAIHGAGTMHYPTGELDLHLRARNPGGPNLGVITEMLDLVRDQLVGIRVTGTIDQPRARVVGLEDLRRPWTDAFGPSADAPVGNDRGTRDD
ncbi:MAG: hypothetical protein WD118_01895 [Phycisphaeraceae bacterium]